jgi:hypothetical protein
VVAQPAPPWQATRHTTRSEAAVPEPEYVTLNGGPMDGYHMPVTGWSAEQRAVGVAHICETGSYGPGGRACYGPPEHDPLSPVWVHEGDMP